MDRESVTVASISPQVEVSSLQVRKEESQVAEQEDPYSLSGPYIALFGLTIAIVAIGVPFVAVLTERPIRQESVVPTALGNGSKSSLPISFTRVGQSGS